MEYRTIDAKADKVSLLGFGCMRFPMTAEGKIERAEAEKMLDRAYAAGINYFDTAYPYHGGESEELVGKVMQKYPRDSFLLATKLPCWEIKCLADAKRIFKLQLDKLQTEYFDFYLIHALNRNSWKSMKELGIIEYAEQLKKDGYIHRLGFSFHDDYEVFKDIINYRKWDFCQIQLNYMDTEYQAGIKGYDLATSLDVPVIIMEPIKGGSLAQLPDDIMDRLNRTAPQKSAASFALRWVSSFPNVKVVLSGMSSMEQLEQNLDTFENFSPFTTVEHEAVKEVVEQLHQRVKNNCTACRYCMPCPAGVDIPACFTAWNDWGKYESRSAALWTWNYDLSDSSKPKNCIDCGNCEAACPQHISIREDLRKLEEVFDSLR